MKLITMQNAKTPKGEKYGWLTGILYLAPHKLSGHNVCPSATPGCITSCLNTAGRGRFSRVQSARMEKTKLFFADRRSFVNQLMDEIGKLERKAKKKNLKLAIRLNGTSDLRWEVIAPDIFTKFPNVQFYDYTKLPNRYEQFLEGVFPTNYHLVFSRSESNHEWCWQFLIQHTSKAQIANVYATEELKQERIAAFNTNISNLTMSDGDLHDLVWAHPPGIIALRAKGKGRQDKSGFVLKRTTSVW